MMGEQCKNLCALIEAVDIYIIDLPTPPPDSRQGKVGVK